MKVIIKEMKNIIKKLKDKFEKKISERRQKTGIKNNRETT